MASDHALAAWTRRLQARPAPGRRFGAVRALAARLGVCRPAALTIVIAGTNGKGSVAAFLGQLLSAQGKAVGTTTSPHLHAFNERVRLRGAPVGDAEFAGALDAVEAARGECPLTYFDHATLAALLLIRAAEVDAAVLEVGLGGRLDAVNVVHADLAVITNVALDHEHRLGRTRALIGAEKAGVLRPAKPVVIGEPTPPEVVLARARALAAPVCLAGRDFGSDGRQLWLRRGRERLSYGYGPSAVAAANAATAVAAAALLDAPPAPAEVYRAAATAENPGRFEVVEREQRTWVLDVAHNPAAATFLAAQLRARFGQRPIAAVVGCLAGKDGAGIVRALKPLLSGLVFVDTDKRRGQAGRALRAAAGEPRALAAPLEPALAHVRERSGPDGVILCCGSFDLIERMRVRLHLLAVRPLSGLGGSAALAGS